MTRPVGLGSGWSCRSSALNRRIGHRVDLGLVLGDSRSASFGSRVSGWSVWCVEGHRPFVAESTGRTGRLRARSHSSSFKDDLASNTIAVYSAITT